MKICARLFTLLVVAAFIPVHQAAAQEQEVVTPEEAFLKLQERGLVRQNAIYGEDFIDQIEAGNVEAVKLYLAAGVSPDVSDTQHRQALLVAAEKGNAEVVKVLVDAGADIGVKDKRGLTPLVVAVMHQNDEVVQVFLKREQQN